MPGKYQVNHGNGAGWIAFALFLLSEALKIGSLVRAKRNRTSQTGITVTG